MLDERREAARRALRLSDEALAAEFTGGLHALALTLKAPGEA